MSRRLRWALVAPVLTLPLLMSTAQAEVAPRNSAGWAPLSVQGLSNQVVAGLDYLPDGTLLVAWSQAVDGTEALWTNTVSPGQEAGDPEPQVVATGLGLDPDVLSTATGADIVYLDSNARHLVYDPTTQETTDAGEAYLVEGAGQGFPLDTARRPDGAIVVNQLRRWHVGPAGEGEPGDESLSFDVAPQVDRSAIATAGEDTFLAYWRSSSDPAVGGIWVGRIEPTVGDFTELPGSWYLDQPIAMEASTSGDLWVAYCAGAGVCDQLVLRNVTESRSLVVPTGDYPAQIAVAPAPDGRMWVVWRSGNAAVSAARTNKAGTAFGAVQRSAPFNTLNAVQSVVAAGDRGPVDVVMNGQQRLWHKRFLVPMTATGSPAKWRVNRRQTVAFTVRDAGDTLSGAKVALVGRTCTTGSTGRCTITVPARSAPATLTAAVTKAGYRATAVTLRVVR